MAGTSLPAPASAGSATPFSALTGPQLGEPAPAFSLKTIDGRMVSLDAYRGKTLVLNVWATWCPPCRMEMPQLISAYAALRKTNVEVLGVDTTEQAPIVRAYVSSKSVPYPQALDSEKTFAKAYDVQYFPTTYVIDPQGVLRARYIDQLGPQQLAQLVAGGRESRNVSILSPLQTKIDGILSDPSLTFDGDAASVAANAKRAADAIAAAEKATDDSDPAKGMTVDLLRTRAEEQALRTRATDALAKTSPNDADKIVLGLLRGGGDADREAWDDALNAYGDVLALDPKNEDALAGTALAAGRLGNDGTQIEADVKLSALHPNAVEPLVDLGIALGHAGRFGDAYATFDTATTIGTEKLEANPKNAKTLRTLAWAYLYEGRTHAKGGDVAKARLAYARSLSLATKLPANDERHDMYLEENQEALVALDLGGPPGATSLTLVPWTGPALPGSVPHTIKYRLTVAGAAGRMVALQTAGVPSGWIASFCTDKICSPSRVSVGIPPSGVKVIEFQLVPPNARATHASVRILTTAGGKTASAST